MKTTKLILQISALTCSAGMFIYLIINGKVGIASDYFVDDYLILAVLSLLLLVGFNKDKWRYKHEVYSTISAMNILPFAIFSFAMIKTIYKKNRKTISNALLIASLSILIAFGIASYYIENQSKHCIVIAIICAVITASKILENNRLNKEALQDV